MPPSPISRSTPSSNSRLCVTLLTELISALGLATLELGALSPLSATGSSLLISNAASDSPFSAICLAVAADSGAGQAVWVLMVAPWGRGGRPAAAWWRPLEALWIALLASHRGSPGPLR